MYTANTMASRRRGAGHVAARLAPRPPAVDRRRDGFARRSGEAVVELLRRASRPATSSRREAFENAIAVVMALGGSTNAVLHLLAIAHEAEVELDLDDFNRVGDQVPHLADVKPFGQYVMTDVDRIGGVPVVMKALLDAGLLHGDALTVTGRTVAENLAEHRAAGPGRQDHPRARPTRSTRPAASRSCSGSLAPEGAVVKTAGFDADVFEGTARVFDGEAAAMDAVEDGTLAGRRRRGDPLRGPQGRPRHARDARRHRRHQGRRASARTSCCVTDGRFSGGTTGLCIGHVAPEAVDGGPIAFVRDGDRIRLDIAARTLDLLVDEAELAARRAGLDAPAPRHTRGVLAKYARLVGSAARAPSATTRVGSSASTPTGSSGLSGGGPAADRWSTGVHS